MRLPDFIIIGSPKAGTTTLAKWVANHPDIYFFPPKETHYFNYNFDRGLAWYKKLFSAANEKHIVGEATPDYTEGNTNLISERMAATVPDAKLIFIVRHPIDRLESHYFQCIADGAKPIPFEQAVQEWPTLVETSKYYEKIAPFFQRFPAENIRVFFMEDLKANEAGLLRRLFSFLGLEVSRLALTKADLQIENSRETKSTDGALLKRLRAMKFFDDIKWLIPRSIVQKGKSFLKKPLKINDLQIDWSVIDSKEILAELEADRQAFFDLIGETREMWNLSQSYLDDR